MILLPQSESSVPDVKKSPKTHNKSWHMSHRTQKSLVQYPVRVISVAVAMKMHINFISVFIVLYRRTMF